MGNKSIVDYQPISFSKNYLALTGKILGLFIAAWILVFLLSDGNRKQLMIGHLGFAFLIIASLTIIALVQTWLNSPIYIYRVQVNDCIISIKWQDRKQFKEMSVSVKDVKAQLKPSGKNTQYLEITIKAMDKPLVLKQTVYPGWTRKGMQDFIDSLHQVVLACKE